MTNLLGFQTIRFDFTQPDSATIGLKLSAALAASAAGYFELDAGLDGHYRFTANGPRNYQVALRGKWVGEDQFAIDYVEPAGSNAFTMHFHFDGSLLSAQVRDRPGLYGEHTIRGIEDTDQTTGKN